MSVKEGKITRKDPFDYEKWGLHKLDALFFRFCKHDKDIKYPWNLFHVWVQSMKKRKLSSYWVFLFRKFSPLGPENQ